MAIERMVEGIDTRWITQPLGHEHLGAGLPAPWMPVGVRILHAIWESPHQSPGISHHEARAEAVQSGQVEPVYVGEVNLEEVGTSTGVALTMETPPQGWRRLRWAAVASRLGVELDATEGTLERQLRPFMIDGSWPVSVLPPPGGTLDALSLRRLADALAGLHDGQTIGYSTRDEWFGDGGFSRGTVREVFDLSLERGYSPNNWWSDDESWLVWTDYDLQTSAFFGESRAVEIVTSIPEFEVLPYADIWWPEGSTLNP